VSPIIDVVAPRLLAPALMVAFALIVKGYTDVGEGFSAGVIVALAVALRYMALGRRRADRTLALARRADVVAAGGLLIALAFGFVGVAFGQPAFTHLPPPGDPVIHIGTLELTTAIGFDVGLFLLVFGSLVVLIRHLSGLIPDRDVEADDGLSPAADLQSDPNE
jgi:multicomponent Na+:H+ antiporter subunit B